ncbi:MAG: putative bifunctional diguanylate cyclase/phosphodiesterase [Nocardioides sp.]
MSTTETRGRSAGLWVYIGAIALVGVAVHVTAVLPIAAGGDRAVSWPSLVAVTLGFFAAQGFVVVHLRLGGNAFAFSMMEIPLVLGLFFVRPDLLLVARLVGGLAAYAWQRKVLVKTAFNCALFLLETSAAVAVWNFVVGAADPVSPVGWLATGLAVLTTGVISSTLVTGVIVIVSGELPGSLDEVFSLGQLGDLANAALALVGVYILSTDWRAVWLLGVVVVVLAVAYRSYEGARTRSESLEQVNRFTEMVGRDVEVDAVVQSVLNEVGTAFQVQTVQLRLSRPFDGDEDWMLVGDVIDHRHCTLVDRLAEHAEGGTVLVPRHPKSVELAQLLEDEDVRDCLMVPLRSVGQVAGSLVVADRLSEVAPFTAADVNQLQALANHAAVALENAVRAEMIIHQAEEREHEAMHDELTGLANRRLFSRMLEDRLATRPVALLLLDLDRFKEVNDTLGHEVGDRLLRVVGERIREASPGGSVVARLGGDEFAVLLPGADDFDARACATLLRDALTRPMVLGGFSVAVDASVGVATGSVGDSAVTMLRWADLAMYAAKHSRAGLEVYRPELDQQDSSRLGLLADLRVAVAAETLEIAYQPKVDLRSGEIIGVEALARWNHPELGCVPPDEFIPLAEHSTLITPLTMLMLRRALRDGERWRAAVGEFSVAVNISPRSLLDLSFVDEVARELARVDLPPSSLILEITETNLMTDPERAITALQRLRAIGVRLSVDDLGTGYSSLAYLQRLPVDEIKIDRSFLSSFDEPSAQAVVGTIVDLGHRLGKQVVAEGVEVSASLDALRLLGCDCAQGYWIARPMPAAQLTRFLEGKPPRETGSLRLVQ